MIVDTIALEKATAQPTDSRLLDVDREKIFRLAQRAEIELKLTHECEAIGLCRRVDVYAHAPHFRSLNRVLV